MIEHLILPRATAPPRTMNAYVPPRLPRGRSPLARLVRAATRAFQRAPAPKECRC